MADVLHGLAGFENLLERQRLSGNAVAFRVGQTPVQNAGGSRIHRALGEAENFLRAMVGKSDFARLVGDDDADGAGFHDAADEIAFAAEIFLGAPAFDGVTDGAFQNIGVELAFDQVVRGSRLHGFDVNLVIALPGQQNHRRPAAERF